MIVPLIILFFVLGLMFFKDTAGRRNKILKYILMAANILLIAAILFSSGEELSIHPTYILIGLLVLVAGLVGYFLYRKVLHLVIRKERTDDQELIKNGG